MERKKNNEKPISNYLKININIQRAGNISRGASSGVLQKSCKEGHMQKEDNTYLELGE